MSTFVLNRNYKLILLEGYVSVENEEMEYIDGGWSMKVFTKNMVGVAALGGALAYIVNKAIMPILSNSYAYGLLVAKLSPYIAKIGIYFGGWVGLAVFGASTAAAVYVLGTKSIFY